MLRMRFGSFVWPNNPRTYTISCKRQTAVHKVPMGGFVVQDLGRTATVMKGEGEFFGADAYSTFLELLAVFQKGGRGTLVHPVWQTAGAYLTELELTQEPRDDYVAYRFTFCEAPGAAEEAAGDEETNGRRFYELREGQTLWTVSNAYGLSMTELLRLNPQIAKPNEVQAGRGCGCDDRNCDGLRGEKNGAAGVFAVERQADGRGTVR